MGKCGGNPRSLDSQLASAPHLIRAGTLDGSPWSPKTVSSSLCLASCVHRWEDTLGGA